MENFYGQLDLTKLGDIVRKHPNAIREVTFKDGSVHKFINIDVYEKQQPDQYGRTHYVKAGIKKAEQVEGVNYYIADLKPSEIASNTTSVNTAPVQSQDNDNDLPF